MRRVQLTAGVFLFLAISFSPGILNAQSAAVGASYALLSLAYPDDTQHGVGAWLTWDFAGAAMALDLGVNAFADHPVVGHQTDLLAGVRSGIRFGKVGVFGRVRPGVVHFSERFLAPDIACIAIFPTPEACFAKSTNFALEFGGTVEFYPTPSALIRIDVGDTLIRYERTGLDATWKDNFQFAAGGGFRF